MQGAGCEAADSVGGRDTSSFCRVVSGRRLCVYQGECSIVATASLTVPGVQRQRRESELSAPQRSYFSSPLPHLVTLPSQYQTPSRTSLTLKVSTAQPFPAPPPPALSPFLTLSHPAQSSTTQSSFLDLSLSQGQQTSSEVSFFNPSLGQLTPLQLLSQSNPLLFTPALSSSFAHPSFPPFPPLPSSPYPCALLFSFYLPVFTTIPTTTFACLYFLNSANPLSSSHSSTIFPLYTTIPNTTTPHQPKSSALSPLPRPALRGNQRNEWSGKRKTSSVTGKGVQRDTSGPETDPFTTTTIATPTTITTTTATTGLTKSFATVVVLLFALVSTTAASYKLKRKY